MSKARTVTIRSESSTQPRESATSRKAKLLLFLTGAGSALFLRERMMRNPALVRDMLASLWRSMSAAQRLWIPGLPVEARAAAVVLLQLIVRAIRVLLSTNRAVGSFLGRVETQVSTRL